MSLLKIAISLLLIIVFSLLVLNIKINEKGNEVLINATVLEDDIFKVYFLFDSLTAYSEKYSVKQVVTGSKENQIIKFKIPLDLNINKLRIDLGRNRNQKAIEINSLIISHLGEDLFFRDKEIYQVFKPNQFVLINKDSTILHFEAVQGRYDPFLYSTKLFDEKVNPGYITDRIKYLLHLFTPLALFIITVFVGYNYKQILESVIYSTLFFGLLLAPLTAQLLDLNRIENTQEKRKLAEMPQFSWELDSFSKKFELYFNDNFGLRSILVNYEGLFKIKAFGSSNTPNVALGKKNWLFLSGDFNDILKDFSRKNLYDKQELHSMVEKWERRKKTLNFINISYYKAFWPNKHSIYPEHLPYNIRVQQLDTVSRPDQVINYLHRSHSDVDLIDVRDNLIHAKKSGQLYYKHDTHWNDYGAFIASRELINIISDDHSQIKTLNIEDFKIKWKTTTGGDLTNLLGVNPNNYKDKRPIFTLIKNNGEVKELHDDRFPAKTKIFYNAKCTNDLTILVFRDSFTSAMIKFLSPHFKKSMYISTSYDQEMVELVQPDIVVEGFVERLLR